MRIFLLAMLALPLAVGCGGEAKNKPAGTADTGRSYDTDTDTDTDADCTAFDMALEQAETVAPSVVRISFKLTCDGRPVPGKIECTAPSET